MIITKPAEFRQNQKDFLQKAYDGEPVVVARVRSENVVVVNQDDYQELLRENRLMMYYFRLKESGALNENREKSIINKILNSVEDVQKFVADDSLLDDLKRVEKRANKEGWLEEEFVKKELGS